MTRINYFYDDLWYIYVAFSPFQSLKAFNVFTEWKKTACTFFISCILEYHTVWNDMFIK